MMKTRCSRLTATALALLAGIAASLIPGSSSAGITRATSSLVVPITGTVADAPESIAPTEQARETQGNIPLTAQARAAPGSITLTGQVRITSVLATDPDFGGPPSILLTITLLNVTGVRPPAGAKYLARGEDKVIRPLQHSDLVEINFPIFPAGSQGSVSGPALPHSALASFQLTFDVKNGQLKAAKAKFSRFSSQGKPE